MKHALRHILLVLAIAGFSHSGDGGTIIGKVGQTTFSTTNNAPGFNLDVYGDWIENIDRVEAPAGVTVTIVSKRNGAQNNTGQFAGKGDVTLRITTSNATPGTKTINLINDPPFGDTFSFTISVVAPPAVTSIDAPSPADPFQDIVVTLQGSGLQGAKDQATGTIVNDNLIPFITVGGTASVNSVRILNSTPTTLQLKIFFTALIQDATVEVKLISASERDALGSIVSPGGFKTRMRVKSTNIKNYVESFSFPTGSTFDKNSIGTINLNLLFAASASGVTLASTKLRTGQVLTFPVLSDNGKVFVKLVPPNAFTRPDGTPFPTNSSGLITFNANPGDDVVPVTFKVVDCLGGQSGQSNAVKIQTWMHSTSTNLPPDFIEKQFFVRCTQ
jgi:hypothetical protein